MQRQGYVYILASKRRGTLYIGVTAELMKRIYEHQKGLVEGFTARHGVKRLVYYEIFEDISDAIRREKQLKNWKRGWKIQLIEEQNPEWADIYPALS